MDPFEGLPGHETIREGLEDMEHGRETVPGLCAFPAVVTRSRSESRKR